MEEELKSGMLVGFSRDISNETSSSKLFIYVAKCLLYMVRRILNDLVNLYLEICV